MRLWLTISVISILLKERVRRFSVEARRTELTCVIWRYSLWYDYGNLIIVQKELFLINAQLTIISLVAQGLCHFQDVSIKSVSILGWFDPSTSLNLVAFSIYLQIEYFLNKQIRLLCLNKETVYDTMYTLDLYRFLHWRKRYIIYKSMLIIYVQKCTYSIG